MKQSRKVSNDSFGIQKLRVDVLVVDWLVIWLIVFFGFDGWYPWNGRESHGVSGWQYPRPQHIYLSLVLASFVFSVSH